MHYKEKGCRDRMRFARKVFEDCEEEIKGLSLNVFI